VHVQHWRPVHGQPVHRWRRTARRRAVQPPSARVGELKPRRRLQQEAGTTEMRVEAGTTARQACNTQIYVSV
jgi:hypothetical protein